MWDQISYSAHFLNGETCSAKMWFIFIEFLIVFGEQWRPITQTNKL